MSVDRLSSRFSDSRLGDMTRSLQGNASSLLSTGQGWLDRFVPPQQREELKNRVARFANERPYLASFLLSQTVLSGPAIALFVIFTLTVAIFSLLSAILVAVVGALSFIVVAVGMALCFLLPTLFVTTSITTAIFLWGVGVYLLFTWFSERDLLWAHTEEESGMQKQRGLDDVRVGVPGRNALTQEAHDDGNETKMSGMEMNGVRASGTDKYRFAEMENQAVPRKLEYSDGPVMVRWLGRLFHQFRSSRQS